MDRIDYYRQCVKKFLTEYSNYGSQQPEMETQLIFDTVNDHYLLLRTGWDDTRRVHCCIFHFDIKDGKIWVQENNTDLEIDEDLEEMGISKKEIVVGFHHPDLRQYSKYAVS